MNEFPETNSRKRLRGALALVITAMLAAALLSTVNRLTARRITENVDAERLESLREVLPAGSYDNDPHLDIIMATDPELLGSQDPMPIYRARRDGQPVAAVLTAVAPNGFSDRIRLLVGIGYDGEVTGVRVTEHRETPGLGDRVEIGKSSWIMGFTGMRLNFPRKDDPLSNTWVLKRDGGTFDQITGATVTSRAVLQAVRNAVLYFASHRQEIFSSPDHEQPDSRN